jgi:RNA polymerase sigma factor (sigma-70 family)
MQTTFSDEDLVRGIMRHEDRVLRYLYTNLYGKVESFVTVNNGSKAEAKDVFQEGVIALYQNLESGRYQLESTTKLTSYLFQICKFKWYSQLRSAHKKRTIGSVDNLQPGIYDVSFEKDTHEWEEIKYVRDAIDKLGDACKDLLLAFYFEEKSMKEIAQRLGQQTNSVKNAKYRCMQKLKEILKTRVS